MVLVITTERIMSDSPEIPKESIPFRMTITDIYVIKARGVVVVGDIESGTPKKNHAICVTGRDKIVYGSIAGVHTNPSNKSLGILLKSIRREDIGVGMVLTTEGAKEKK